MMAAPINCIKVTQLPQTVTEDELKILFKNRRGQGGGPVASVTINAQDGSPWALIVFEDAKAVDTILSRGNTVTIKNQTAFVAQYEECTTKQSEAEIKPSKPKRNVVQDTADVQLQHQTQETLSAHRGTTPLKQNEKSIENSFASGAYDSHDFYPVDEMTFDDDDGLRRTIKATVVDVLKSKESYIYYLEDTSALLWGQFDEDSLLLDCLNRNLFVTFFSESDAVEACARDLGPESYFEYVEMASDDDFNIFEDRVSVHGLCLENQTTCDKFLRYVNGKTQSQVKELIQQDESRSAILVFDEETCQDIFGICWKLKTVYKGTQILSAPVFKPKSIIFYNLPSKIDKDVFRRYISNARSGGGDIDSIEWQGGQAIVTFKSEKHFHGVLQKQDHWLEGSQLGIKPYFPCLSKLMYQKCIDSQRQTTKQEKHLSGMEVDNPTDQEMHHCAYQPSSLGKEKEVDLEKTDTIIMQETDFLNDFQNKHTKVKIELDSTNQKIIIKGLESDVHKVATDLLQRMREIKCKKIFNLSPSQVELLETEDVQREVNEEFKKDRKQAVLKIENSVPKIFYMQPTNVDSLQNSVMQQIKEDTKHIPDSNAKLLFASTIGREFLCSFKASGFLVRYDGSRNSLLIIGPEKDRSSVHKRIDDFMRENAVHIKTVSYSPGKLLFLNKYKSSELTSLKARAKNQGVSIQEKSNAFEVKGRKEDVKTTEDDLVKIRDSILAEEFCLKFFGIKEFLSEKEGNLIKSGIESNLSCCICPSNDQGNSSGAHSFSKHKAESAPEPSTVATTCIDGYTLHFMQGDLLGLRVAAIVNPVDETLQMSTSGGLCKAILQQGGEQIQQDLNKASDSKPVIATGCGHLDKCQHILHVVLPEFKSDGGLAIQMATSACLDLATEKRLTSIGFPALGSGNKFKYPTLAVCMQTMNAIKGFIEKEATSPTDIFVCDKSEEILSALLGRCEQTFPDNVIDHLKELEQSPKKAPAPRPRRSHYHKSSSSGHKDFGHIHVKVHEGEVTKWKIDAIVIAVNKSLDLNKGTLAKIVLRHGGDSIQEELNDNHPDGIRTGEFAQTSGGDLKCKHIFFACVAHWKGGDTSQESRLENLVEKILEAAESNSLSSIAIPALGTGKLHYPSDVVAEAVSNAVTNFAKKNPGSRLKTVDIVIFPQDKDILDVFKSHVCGDAASSKTPSFGASSSKRSDDDNDDDDDDKSSGSHGIVRAFKNIVGKVGGLFGDSSKIKYGSATLTVSKGDITQEKCDAIVSSIKNSMNLSASGAVCKNLLKICGSSLQDECNDQRATMQQTGVAETSAPSLPCQKIYHVSMETFSTCWDKGVLEVLNQAEAKGATSIALPLLGSGAKNPDLDRIKKRFLAGVEKFGTSHEATLKDIRLIIFSSEMYDAFMGKDQQSRDRPKEVKKSLNKEIAKVKSKTSEKIDLKIYANNYTTADKVKKELIRSYKEAFHQDKLENDRIVKLNQQQIHDLELFAWKNRVQIIVRPDNGEVVFRSFFKMNQVIQKLSTLMIEAVESHHQALHKATPTSIVWQFKDAEDKWHNFEPLINVEVEKEYKQKSQGCDITDSRNRKYHLDFKAMKEFAVKEDGNVSRHGTQIRRFDKTRAGEPLPGKWDSMGPNDNLKIVDVKSGSEEYTRIETLFAQGGVTVPVKGIRRIQNKFLYQHFMVKKREMDQRNGKDFKNEKRLFHGTSPQSMAAINENGFSNNYSGVNATAYGDGTYFAVKSSYSVTYASPDLSGIKHMYLVRVLVGKSTVSRSGMKYLPNQPGTNTPYDSGVDGNNVMYIIFQDAQTYPEYLISF